MSYRIKAKSFINALIKRLVGMKEGILLNRGFSFHVVARDPFGNIKWKDDIDNLVVTEGLNNTLDVMFHGSSQTGTWYIGLTAGSPSPAAGDVMTNHAGWTEVQAYDEATRVAFVEGAASAGSMDNVGNEAVFTISTNDTIVGGGFLVANNVKGGTTGPLFCCGAFSAGNKTLDDNDTLTVTLTLTAADDGV